MLSGFGGGVTVRKLPLGSRRRRALRRGRKDEAMGAGEGWALRKW